MADSSSPIHCVLHKQQATTCCGGGGGWSAADPALCNVCGNAYVQRHLCTECAPQSSDVTDEAKNVTRILMNRVNAFGTLKLFATKSRIVFQKWPEITNVTVVMFLVFALLFKPHRHWSVFYKQKYVQVYFGQEMHVCQNECGACRFSFWK